MVIQRRRDGLLGIDYIFMADVVQLFGSDAGLDVGSNHMEDIGG